MNNKVSIITLGCKQNKYESDCMAEILKENGFDVFEGLEFADFYIINTCAVTSEAEKKSRQCVQKCNKLNPNAKIIICGCASENNIEQFKNKTNVLSIFGTEGKQNILNYINKSIEEKEKIPTIYSSPKAPKKTTTREYLKIQDGCNNFCSYCLIPYLRGRSRSRDIEDIISEAKVIANRSYEIVLTGIDISSFQVDGKPALPLLMSRLGELPALISLGSLEMNVINVELLEVLKKMPNFSPHFHLSLQSGNDEILKKMNRHYTTEEFYEKVKLIKKYFPYANLTTDVIVGFAGETEEQFESTKQFIIKCGFSFVHIFPYSKRKGTRAYDFPDLSSNVKKKRVDILEQVNEKLKNDYLSNFIGRKSILLVEEKKEYWEGFSTEYIRCYSEENLSSGKLYDIEFIEVYNNGMKVKILGERKNVYFL
ncbi:MAG: tRNA (N(6)-L-threonylcarbamoyladenosine(37)-C(2))-methylthiotransferase MtaB [Christensenellales bacterium]